MGIEHEIVKQLNACAVLMSDPVILRNHPAMVADQLLAARASIEMLGGFLRAKQPADPCGCHHKGWMDVSIITEGMGKLVAKLLATHLGVIRTEKFPCIVEVELQSKIEGEPDNYTVREIKESCCMGAIVLLYYHLFWYLFLIRMNQRIDPTFCTQDQLDISWLMTNLPRSHAFLEFRHLGDAFRAKGSGDKVGDKLTALFASQAAYPYMFTTQTIASRQAQTRKTFLVAAFRRTLDTNIGYDSIADVDLEFSLLPKEISSYGIFNTITADSILRDMILMGGMRSTFERNNPLQKWKDMHQVIRVRGLGRDDYHPQSFDGSMSKILASPPYATDKNEFQTNATRACIYDHCSAAIMMDVCRSFQVLSELNRALHDEKDVFPYAHAFLMQLAGYNTDATGLTAFLKSFAVPDPKRLTEPDAAFISKTDDAIMVPETIIAFRTDSPPTKGISLWLDEFKNYYPTRASGVQEDVNRACFLFNFLLDKENECKATKWMEIIQGQLIETGKDDQKHPFCWAFSLALICAFTRNAWMLNHGTHAVKVLMDKLMHTPGFRNVKQFEPPGSLFTDGADIRLHGKNHSSSFLYVVWSDILKLMGRCETWNAKLVLDDPAEKFIEFVKKNCSEIAYDSPVSFTDILNFAVEQKRTLDTLTLAAKGFSRYPALAWPVQYKGIDNTVTSNTDRFNVVREGRKAGSGKLADFPELAEELKRDKAVLEHRLRKLESSHWDLYSRITRQGPQDPDPQQPLPDGV